MTTSRLREVLSQRTGNLCEYCRASPLAEFWPYQIEHIIALVHGGTDDLNNLAFACRRCNEFKGPNIATLDPETGILVPLFNPRTQRWEDHFKAEGPGVSGVTPVGRGTVQLLRTNETNRLEVRSRLV